VPLPRPVSRGTIPDDRAGASQSIGFGVIINLKLTHLALSSLLFLASAVICPAQTTISPNPSDVDQSTQSSATSTTETPASSVPKRDKPGDQPSAQTDPTAQTNPPDQNSTDPTKKKDDRMFYVMPNYLTVDSEAQAKPISWKEKFAISAKGSFDPYEFAIVGIVAGIRQAENSSPGFGQGAEGYAKRYGAAFADQVDGNIMVGGVYPTILRLDPRYFRLGTGKFVHRFGYAISRIFVARKDSGGHTFNVPEFAGNATAIAISTLYYPSEDRDFSTGLSGWGTQMGLDAFGNELKEFWPDVHHYVQKRQARYHERKEEKMKAKENN
jgi:hypothetical protein